MKKFLIIMIFALICMSLFSQEKIVQGDVKIILFDISKSMIGHGKEIDIFDDVKETTSFIINDLSNEDYLMLLPYHAGLDDETFATKIEDDEDKSRAITFIKQLKAVGLNTWLTKSYTSALQKIDNIKISDNSDIDILILTDGKGNGREDIDSQTGEFCLDNFIEQYNITKNDYPFLFTKFVTVRERIFASAQKNTLKKEGIDVGKITQTPKSNKIYISPEEIICNSQNKNFILSLQFSNKLDGDTIQLIEITNQYKITPSSVTLDKSEQQYSFMIKPIVNNPGEGKIKIIGNNRKKIIYLLGENLKASNVISLKYLIEPSEILLNTEKVNQIKNYGKLRIYFKTKQSQKIPTSFVLSSSNKDLQFSLRNSSVKSSKKGIIVNIIPKDKNTMKDYLWNLDKDQTFKMDLKVISEDINFKYHPEKIKFNIVVTKPFLKKMLPFLIVLAVLLILLTIFIITKKIFTAKFPKDATLTIDVNLFSLKAKPFHKKITVGTNNKSDIQINAVLFKGTSGEILEIYKSAGNSVKVISVNTSIRIGYGTSKGDCAFVDENKSFAIIEEFDSINCKYKTT